MHKDKLLKTHHRGPVRVNSLVILNIVKLKFLNYLLKLVDTETYHKRICQHWDLASYDKRICQHSLMKLAIRLIAK